MSLDAAQRRRYARQLLVAEIGEPGQQCLLAARFRPDRRCDPDAYAVAAEYLERAGLCFDAHSEHVKVADPQSVVRLAGTAELSKPAAVIAGAFAAVEHLKEVLGIAEARDLPADLRLHDEG